MTQHETDPDQLAAIPGTAPDSGPAGDAPVDASAVAVAPVDASTVAVAPVDASTAGASPEDALAVAVSHLPDALPVTFTMKIRGGAYDRLEVDTFMSRLAQATADVRAAATAVHEEFAVLRAENGKPRVSSAGSDDEITAGAVGLLTQAQQIADKAIADAEQYARDLVLTARNQYREILQRAESSASHATASITTQHGAAVPEIEYVRTYAQVAQIQLRSVLEALTDQVDRLGSLPAPAPEPVAQAAQPDSDDGPTGEPEWEPSIPSVPSAQPV